MDLELKDFNTAFLDSEVIPIKLKTMGNKQIYLRALCRADIMRFNTLCREVTARSAFNILTNKEDYKEIRDADLDAAEDYLIVKSLCNCDGELLFSGKSHYKKWSENASNNSVDEILKNIKEEILYRDDFKKK